MIVAARAKVGAVLAAIAVERSVFPRAARVIPTVLPVLRWAIGHLGARVLTASGQADVPTAEGRVLGQALAQRVVLGDEVPATAVQSDGFRTDATVVVATPAAVATGPAVVVVAGTSPP